MKGAHSGDLETRSSRKGNDRRLSLVGKNYFLIYSDWLRSLGSTGRTTVSLDKDLIACENGPFLSSSSVVFVFLAKKWPQTKRRVPYFPPSGWRKQQNHSVYRTQVYLSNSHLCIKKVEVVEPLLAAVSAKDRHFAPQHRHRRALSGRGGGPFHRRLEPHHGVQVEHVKVAEPLLLCVPAPENEDPAFRYDVSVASLGGLFRAHYGQLNLWEGEFQCVKVAEPSLCFTPPK